jgi:hypothetical protein
VVAHARAAWRVEQHGARAGRGCAAAQGQAA